MTKIYLADRDQLKCNFCTKWFSVSTQFAKMQRYSLNACQACFSNFKYTLVSPVDYEVYNVYLVNAGYKLSTK